MNLVATIKKIYPAAMHELDYVAQSVAGTPTITAWTYGSPQPTTGELATAWALVQADDAADAAAKATEDAASNTVITKLTTGVTVTDTELRKAVGALLRVRAGANPAAVVPVADSNPPSPGGGMSEAQVDARVVAGITGKLDTNHASVTNARTPVSHTHAPTDITGTAVVDADARLSDARTPTAHAHAIADTTGLQAALALPCRWRGCWRSWCRWSRSQPAP
jgi:hypothetical protein